MIHVARKTQQGWETDRVGVEDPREALETIREQPELEGSKGKLFAFELGESKDQQTGEKSPIFQFCGSLDAA